MEVVSQPTEGLQSVPERTDSLIDSLLRFHVAKVTFRQTFFELIPVHRSFLSKSPGGMPD
jgi:hypothetical protein